MKRRRIGNYRYVEEAARRFRERHGIDVTIDALVAFGVLIQDRTLRAERARVKAQTVRAMVAMVAPEGT